MATKSSKLNGLMLLIVISFSVVAVWAASAHDQKSTIAWEYKTVTEYYGDKPVDLNALGAEGWELVAVTSGGKVGDRDGFSGYFFKRKK